MKSKSHTSHTSTPLGDVPTPRARTAVESRGAPPNERNHVVDRRHGEYEEDDRPTALTRPPPHPAPRTERRSPPVRDIRKTARDAVTYFGTVGASLIVQVCRGHSPVWSFGRASSPPKLDAREPSAFGLGAPPSVNDRD
jgi:hypothetical protein